MAEPDGTISGNYHSYQRHRVFLSVPHILGILSLIALAIACYAIYLRHLAGGWRRTYVITAVISLYFNGFVLVAQAFMKVPALQALAPTQTESPFKLAQGCVLILFIFGVLALQKFRGASLLPG